MVDLGTISCEDLGSSRITQTILETIDHVPPSPQPAMCRLTLNDISREKARGLNRVAIADAKVGLLDFKLRIIPREEDTPVFEGQDIVAVDYLKEFKTFIKNQHLDPDVEAFVTKKGMNILARVIEHHREEQDAAQ